MRDRARIRITFRKIVGKLQIIIQMTLAAARSLFENCEDSRFCFEVSELRSVLVLTFRITEDTACDVNDQEWDEVVFYFRQFLRWVKRERQPYCFVFDMHCVTQLPVHRVYSLQQYLKTKHSVLSAYLNCSVLITSSALVHGLLEAALLAVPSTRPVHPLLCARGDTEVDAKVHRLLEQSL